MIVFCFLVLFCLWIFVNERACHNEFLYKLLGFTKYDCINCGENKDLVDSFLWFYGLITCGVFFILVFIRIFLVKVLSKKGI